MKTKHETRVTVLMPVYNAEAHLKEAIDSILAQTFTDFEFLIINDGSSDSSEEIIQSYSDSRIRYVRNPANLKLIRTLNSGLKLAKGEYIARMDADDICMPDRLERQVAFMDANKNIGICGSWFRSFGNTNAVVKYPGTDPEIRFMALFQCPFCHPSVILRSSVIRKNELEFSTLYPHAEDYEFWLRAGRVTEFANLESVLLNYRQHIDSVSVVESDTQVRLSLEIRRMFFNELGLSTNDEELDLFRRMNYQFDTLSAKDLRNLASLLSKMLTANSKTSFVPQSWLYQTLSLKWLNTCLNHAYLGLDVWNLYRSYRDLKSSSSYIADAKVFAKCLFKFSRS